MSQQSLYFSEDEKMNFDPASDEKSNMLGSISLVEATVIDTIVMGSGGPDNGPITDAGLRFVRHIISKSKASRFGFLPNLKDMNCIQDLARDFIASQGSASTALETMYQVMQQ